jgi:glycosyltransferase involved in cell wall biosynthesis
MKLLIISPVPTDPATAGNRTRVSNLVTILERLGHSVSFAYVTYETADYVAMEKRFGRRLHILRSKGPPPFPRFTGRAKRKLGRVFGLKSAHLWNVDEWFDDDLLPQVEALQSTEHFETVVIVYVFLSKLVLAFPDSVRTIIDAQDLMGDRHEMYLASGLQPVWFATTPREEIRALNRPDAVIAIQEQEARYLRRHLTNEVFCVGHIGSLDIRLLPDPGGRRILFVGSANPINIHGLELFVRSTFPKIRAHVPDCELVIAGRSGQDRAWPHGVLAVGEVQDLAAVYGGATVVINPVTFGTGLPVKTIEALGYGKALVTTTAGARGLGPEFAGAVRIATDTNQFAQLVIGLLQDEAARTSICQNAIAAVHAWRIEQLTSLESAMGGKGQLDASLSLATEA